MNPANSGTPANFVTASPGYCQEPTRTLNSSSPSPTRWNPKITATSRHVSSRTTQKEGQAEAVDQQGVVPGDRQLDVLRDRQTCEQEGREQAGNQFEPDEP